MHKDLVNLCAKFLLTFSAIYDIIITVREGNTLNNNRTKENRTMKKTTIVKIIIAFITSAIIFYNLGISAVLKNAQPRKVADGYEIEVFGQVYFYED